MHAVGGRRKTRMCPCESLCPAVSGGTGWCLTRPVRGRCGFPFLLPCPWLRPSGASPSGLVVLCGARKQRGGPRPWRASGQLAVNDHCDIDRCAQQRGATEEQQCIHACSASLARSPVSGFRCTARRDGKQKYSNDMMVATPGCRLVVRIFLPQQHLKTARTGACTYGSGACTYGCRHPVHTTQPSIVIHFS
jgi:hypothetical protein